MKKYPLIELPGLNSIEAEVGEVLVNPDGVTYAIDGKPHSKGGTKMLAESGSYILSHHLKLDNEVVKSLTGVDKKLSPADISKKFDTQKWADILESRDKRYDKLAKDTAALMFSKHSAKQSTIYQAQEQHKAKKGMKNDLEDAMSKTMFQSGGGTGSTAGGTPNPFSNVQGFTVNTDRTLGFSEMVDGVPTMQYFPFANDPYFDIDKETLKGGKLTKDQKKILGDRQMRLSTLQQQFPGEQGIAIDKEYAKYIKAADEIEPDKFIDKFVVSEDGTEIPLATATEAQIDAAKSFRYFNKRTGKNDIVDYRDRQNQGFYPQLSYVQQPAPLDTSNLPIKAQPINSLKAPALNLRKVPVADAPSELKKGVDWQSIVNGTQIGLLAADIAATRTKPPYYDFAASELAYTRFEPINTMQQERAFNIARESIENSNLPQQVKAAQLANMYGTMVEGVNQIDLNNYQNKLANDNRNIQTYTQARNTDILREQDSNMRYVAEADRRNYLASAQRQEYLSNIMDTWSKHVANRRDVRLVNQLSNNYDFNFNTEQVEYVPGQGVPANKNRLQAFGSKPSIDPRYLNAEGRRALGYE